LKFKFELGSMGMLLAIAFYAISGIVSLAVLPMSSFPPHLGIIGILSLIVAYGLFRKRVWTIWVIAVLFFVAITFSVYTLYYVWGEDLILDTTMVAYFILTWVFTAYTAAKRKMLEN